MMIIIYLPSRPSATDSRFTRSRKEKGQQMLALCLLRHAQYGLLRLALARNHLPRINLLAILEQFEMYMGPR